MAEVSEILENLVVIKRSGKKVDFDGKKIALAIKKGFASVEVDTDEEEKEKKYSSMKMFIKASQNIEIEEMLLVNHSLLIRKLISF